ncbi:MAG: acyl-CoA dehydrogenase family protein [Actinomycetota bacterium]
MDFSFTEEQDQLAELARRIVTDALSEERMRAVEAAPERFDADLYAVLAKAGILGAGLPTDDGGGGYGLIELCRVLVELGRAVAPVPVLPSIVMGAMPIARFGTREQKSKWVVPAASGERILTAAVVEDLNPDPASPTTLATRTDNGWSLSGTKIVVPAGTIADLFLVPAATDDGVAVFLAPSSAPGLVVSRQLVTNRDADAQIELQGVIVGDGAVLGEIGEGAEIVRWIIRHSTVGLCALQLGVCERALELTAEYSKTRVQFDRPIATFQAVGQRLADAYIDVEGVRLTLWQAVWRLTEGLPCDQEIDTAKFWASDAGHRIAHTTVHVHGGMGIDLDYHAHRYFVAAKRIEFVLGTATDHLRALGSALAAEPA